jgi:two-component system nitrogen regulation response regulator GlnG
MPAELQTRLLRVLADGEFFRVGGHTPIRVDVRIIAATHQDLEAKVRDGSFREDLFHRLNVIRVHSPALRDRREDVPALLSHFLESAAEELGAEVKTLRPEVERYLASLDWPGNVRQLENLCRWLTVMASGSTIHLEDLPPELQEGAQSGEGEGDWAALLERWAERKLAAGGERILDEAVPRFEQVLIDTALRHCRGRRQDAARLLGWGRNTLTRKIKEHGETVR